jgi:protein TonB
MQTNQLQPAHKLLHSFSHRPIEALLSSSLLRITGSFIIGGLITFSLFVIMFKLINNQDLTPTQTPPFVEINAIYSFKETPEIQRNRPKPPPQMIEQPKPQTPEVITNDKTETFSEYQPPQVQISKNLSVGSMQSHDRGLTPIFRANPQYPPEQAQRNTQGYVVLKFDVSEIGRVINIEVLDAEPARVFNRAAIRALKKWRYQPQIVNGEAQVMTGLKVQLDFTLDE